MSRATWWLGLAPRERLVVVLASSAVCLAVLVARVMPAWTGWVASEFVRRQVLTDSLAHMQVRLSQEARVADSIARRQFERELSHTVVLTARSDQEASISLLNLLAAVADDVGVTLSSVQRQSDATGPLAARSTQRTGYSVVSVKAIGSAHPDLIPELLAFVDTSRVQLSTRSVSISAGRNSGSREENVQVELVVSALVNIRTFKSLVGQ